MSDNQFYVLITVIGGGLASIGAIIRFVGSRLVKALDDNSVAMLKQTASSVALSTKIDSISDYVKGIDRPFKRPKTNPKIAVGDNDE